MTSTSSNDSPPSETSGSLSRFTSSALIGGGCSVLTKFVLYPADTIKTRAQTGMPLLPASKKDLFSGLLWKLAFYSPYQAVYMGTYHSLAGGEAAGGEVLPAVEKLKLWLPSSVPLSSPLYAGLAGVLAEISASFIRLPMEVMKQRRQVGLLGGRESVSVWRSPVRRVVNWRLFLGQTVLHDCPYSFIQWTFFSYLQSFENAEGGNAFEEALSDVSCSPFMRGTLAGALGAVATTPLDVIKVGIVTSPSPRPPSIREVAGVVYREGGWKGFFKGVGPRVLHLAPATGIYLGLFGLLQKWSAGETS